MRDRLTALALALGALASALGCSNARRAGGAGAGPGGTTGGGTPTLTAMAPLSGPTAGGTSCTLTGTGFQTGATVSVGGAAASSVTVLSATSITAATPAGNPGAATVVVTNPGGASASLVNGFTYLAGPPPAPTLASVTPAFGPAAGGTPITLAGSGFQTGATVSVGGAAATGVTVSNAGTILCTTPAGTPGAAAVVITNPDAQSATLGTGFTFTTVSTQRLTTAQDWNLQAGAGCDTATTPGDVQLARLPAAFAASHGPITAVAYDHGDTTGRRLLVGTANAGAFLTADGGQTWTAFHTYGSPGLPSDTVRSVALLAGTNGGTFLIGTNAGAVLTVDGGATFTRFDRTTTPALPTDAVVAVAFCDGDTTGRHFLIACTQQQYLYTGGVLVTADGGRSFSVFDDTNVPNLGSTMLVDADYFAGDATGKTWLVAARWDNNSPKGGVWITTDGGASFAHFHSASTVALPGNQVTSARFFQGGTTATTWMATFDTQWGGAGGVAVTTNGGAAFTTRNTGSSPALPSDDVTVGTFGPAATDWLLGTAAAGSVHTTDAGATLRALSTSSTPMLLADAVRAVAWHRTRANDFAIGTAGAASGGPAGACQLTTDQGTSLSPLTLGAPALLPGEILYDVAVFNGDGTGRRILAATNRGAALTTDGGSTWTWFNTTTTPALPWDTATSVAWFEGNTTGTHFCIGTGSGAVVTSDGGQSFTTYSVGNGLPHAWVYDVAYFSGNPNNTTTLLIATYGGLAYTTDGLTFRVFSATSTPALPSASVTCVSFWEGDGSGGTWLAGTPGGLVRTTDGGLSAQNWVVWNQGTSPAIPGNQVTSCDFFDGGTNPTAFAITCTQVYSIPNSPPTPVGVAFTTDGGQSFTHRTTANGLPTNLVRGVTYHQGQTSPSHFALGCFDSSGGLGVATTTDGGGSFTLLGPTSQPAVKAGVLAVDYDDSVAGAGRLVLALWGYGTTGSGVLRLDGTTYAATGTLVIDRVDGRLWNTAVGAPTVADRFVRGLAFFEGNTTATRLVVGGRYGLGLSTDGGTTFTVANPATTPALPTAEVLAVDYFSGDTSGRTVLVGTDRGAFLTTDGGQRFTKFDSGTGLLADHAQAVCFHQGQSSPNRFLIVCGWGVVETTNGGSTFSRPTGNIWGTMTGVDYFDGDTTGARYCVATSNGPFHTENGGSSFTFRGNTMATGPATSVQYFEGDTSGKTWLVGSTNQVNVVGQGGAGLTTDNGATWTVWDAGTTPALASHNVAAVAFFQGTTTPTHFALGLASGGVDVTTDGGGTFTHLGPAAGLPPGAVRRIAFANAFSAGARWAVATDGGVAITRNGGTSFQRVGAGAPSWYDRVTVDAAVPAGTAVTVQVCDAAGALVPDSVLAGNSAGLTPDAQGDVDLSAIPVAGYPSLRLHVRLTTSTPGATPTVHEVRIAYQR